MPTKPITLEQSDQLHNAMARARLQPHSLIATALEKGASVDTLERLVTLAKDVRAWTAREAFYEAIAEFQRRCPPIKKNKVVEIPGRKPYHYPDLGEIVSTIGPLMGELGLAHSWIAVAAPSGARHIALVCRISHKAGHYEDSGLVEMPYGFDGNRMNPAQSVGSATTYAKRQSLCNALGIAAEDDDDAQSSWGERASAPPPKKRPEPRAAAPAAPPVDEAEASTDQMDLAEEAVERGGLEARIAKSTDAKILLTMHRLDLGEGDWRQLDLAAMNMLATHLEGGKK